MKVSKVLYKDGSGHVLSTMITWDHWLVKHGLIVFKNEHDNTVFMCPKDNLVAVKPGLELTYE